MLRRTAALVVTALFALGACSSDEEPPETTGASPDTAGSAETTEPVDYECTDPLADVSSEVDAYDLIVCTTLALADTEGYATTSVVDGAGETMLRVNTEPFTVKVNYADGTAIVANAADAWVDAGDGEWVEADISSDDYLTAQATQIYDTYLLSHDPAYTAADIPDGTVYSVEGSEEIDGVDYTILGAQFADETSTSTLRVWVSDDYRQQKMTLTMEAPDSEPLTVITEYVEWDVPQDIEIPE
ncbi:hypothetical protein [Flaviflexus huanghaiensis]|uniref:hypothetical protein n=1 Tax=Flaviflexus huanghaiensis TaxID=1111473 RepID=UPI0015FDC1BB|nr:hypothetical protein [Flaviflexus huanghaiensis]